MEIITGIVSETGKTIVKSTGTQFSHLIHYDDNIRALEEQANKLADLRADLQRSFDTAERKGEVVYTAVKSWLTRVDVINAQLENFLREETKANPRCLKGWCPNLKSRYSLSKKAKNKSEEVAELQTEGNEFKRTTISTPAPPPKMGSMFKEVKGFESRIKVMNEVLQSLTDDEIHMIGICGMGGVGKTTMVKEVIKTVEREKVFKYVVMAVVSQTPDIERIQGEIADGLGLKFDEGTVRGRAGKLHERMSNETVLIILDDVWKELDLEEIGIPSGSNHKGCKIIVTSREKDVTTKMKSQKDFTVSILSEEEALELFVEMAGDSSKQRDLFPIAQEVAKECGGLPLAIAVVGKALGGKVEEEWFDALNQLTESSVSCFQEMNDLVFERIKFSYNYLGNEEYKSCFLLCCLFPEDFDIPVEFLVQYGVGLKLFKGINSLDKARNRVYAITEKLKRSSLLLASDRIDCVKLHDVVRDCALSIVSQGERVYLVNHGDQLTKWPSEDAYKHCTAISLLCGKIKEYPDAAECPKLELLQLMGGYNMQNEDFSLPKGMEKLKVLAVEGLTFVRHTSLEVLENLRTLCLHYCKLDNLRFLSELKTLEILSLVGSGIGEFSQELGELRHLKVLDLTDATSDEGIAGGILSNLSQLEELYLRKEVLVRGLLYSRAGFRLQKPVKWKSMKEELDSLSSLKTLFVHFPDLELLPQNFRFDNLIRFRISISDGSYYNQQRFYRGPNYLGIHGDLRLIVESGMNQISKRAESLCLRRVDNMKYGLRELEGQGFTRLKDLTLNNCHDLEYVIDAEDCTQQTAFGNLRSLQIERCPMLKNIIPLSINC